MDDEEYEKYLNRINYLVRGQRVWGGYIYNKMWDGSESYVAEHRLVMEEWLDRKLEDYEVVHHINGVKHDNRPENLAVYTRTEHMAEHQRLRKLKNRNGQS